MVARPGDRIGTSIELKKPIARGATASIWSAVHHHRDLDIVVKLLEVEIERDQYIALERFDREARRAGALESGHRPRLYDHGVSTRRQPYLVLERLRGTTLARHLADHGPLGLAAVTRLVTQLCSVLEEAHASDLVHREIDAEEVMVVGAAPLDLRLLGLGVARELRCHREDTAPGTRATGIALRAPEQLVGHAPVDRRCDLWAVAALAYQALTGEPPFAPDLTVRDRLRRGAFPLPSEHPAADPSTNRAIDAWFRAALCFEPAARFASAAEMAAAWNDAASLAQLDDDDDVSTLVFERDSEPPIVVVTEAVIVEEASTEVIPTAPDGEAALAPSAERLGEKVGAPVAKPRPPPRFVAAEAGRSASMALRHRARVALAALAAAGALAAASYATVMLIARPAEAETSYLEPAAPRIVRAASTALRIHALTLE